MCSLNTPGIFNKTDSILIEEEKKDIYLYFGSEMTKVKKGKVINFAEELKKEHAGKGNIIRIEMDENDTIDSILSLIKNHEEKNEDIPFFLRKRKREIETFWNYLNFSKEDNMEKKIKEDLNELYTLSGKTIEMQFIKLII